MYQHFMIISCEKLANLVKKFENIMSFCQIETRQDIFNIENKEDTKYISKFNCEKICKVT